MLTGEPLFAGDPMAVMLKHVRTAPRAPSAAAKQPIPGDLDRIILMCLEKAPEKRPGSALELWRLLNQSSVAGCWPPDNAERWWRENATTLTSSRLDDSSSDNLLPPVRG